MFHLIQRRINVPFVLKSRIVSLNALLTQTFAVRGYLTTNRLQPLTLKFQRQQPILQRSFHTIRPLFEQQQKPTVAAKEEEEVDPNHKMLIGFTCKVCQDRSHHVMSKHSYTKGVVLIQCPGCKNRHLIADNLGWFRDNKTTVEDLAKEKGEPIRKVIVNDQGVERLGDLMEWLPEITEEEKVKKAEAKKKADDLREAQKNQVKEE